MASVSLFVSTTFSKYNRYKLNPSALCMETMYLFSVSELIEKLAYMRHLLQFCKDIKTDQVIAKTTGVTPAETVNV